MKPRKMPACTKLLTILLLTGFVSPGFVSAQTPQTHLDIYLAIGQSNMAGRAEMRHEDTVSIEGAYLWSGSIDHLWVPLTNPLNRFSTIRKDLEMQRLGPGFSFVVHMREARPSSEVGIIVNAKGGTKIVQWLPGTTFFKEAVERTRAAMAFGELKGIIWCQGESDSDSLRTSMYLQRLEVLINALREEFDAPNLPFVCSQIYEKEKNYAFNRMIEMVPDFVQRTGLATTEGLTTTDSTHYDAPSYIELGERFAQEMIKLLE